MPLYLKYYDAIIERFRWIAKKSEAKGGDWRDNVKEFFDDAERYHFDCKLSDRNSMFIKYHTSKSDVDLFSFTLFKDGGEFKCSSAVGFPLEYSDEEREDTMYDICCECINDLERFEKSKKD